MGKFGFFDRFRIPSYNDPEQMEFGIVEIDRGKMYRVRPLCGGLPGESA